MVKQQSQKAPPKQRGKLIYISKAVVAAIDSVVHKKVYGLHFGCVVCAKFPSTRQQRSKGMIADIRWLV